MNLSREQKIKEDHLQNLCLTCKLSKLKKKCFKIFKNKSESLLNKVYLK